MGGSTRRRTGLREPAGGLAGVGRFRRGAPGLGESVGLLTGRLGRAGVGGGAHGFPGLRARLWKPITRALPRRVGRTLRRNARRLGSGAATRARESVAALSLRLGRTVLRSRRRGTRMRESVTALGGRRRSRAPGLREVWAALCRRCRTRVAALWSRCRTRRRTELRETRTPRLPRRRTGPGTACRRRRRRGVGCRSGPRPPIRTLTRHGRSPRTSRPSRRRRLRCLRLERLLPLRRHRRLRRPRCLSAFAFAVALRGRGPLRRRSRRGRLIRGRQRRKPTLRQRRRSPSRRRVLHGLAGPRTKPRHYALRLGVLTPRVPRFRVRRLTLARLSVLRLGVATRPGDFGLRVLGLQVPHSNSGVDLVVLGRDILARTLGSGINLGKVDNVVDNVSGLLHGVAGVAFVLRLAGPHDQALRGRPLNLFVYAIDAIDADVTRPTAERRHLNSIRVVTDVRVGVSGNLDLIGAEQAAPVLKPSALCSRVDQDVAGRLLDDRLVDNRRFLDSGRTVAAPRALGLRSPLLNLPVKSDSGNPHGGATLQIAILRVLPLALALVRSICNGSRRHRRSPRSLKTAPYGQIGQIGQSGRATGVSGRCPG